jgi:hypothetical protein
VGVIVVQWKKDAQLGQKEKKMPQANWIRNDGSDAMQGNTAATLRGSRLSRGYARSFIVNHTTTFLAALQTASGIRPFRLVVARHPTTKRNACGLVGSHRRRIPQIPYSGKRPKFTHRDPVHLH